jgi:hypothetical protein
MADGKADPGTPLALDDGARDQMVETKITCPFLGSAVHQNLLAVRGEAGNPLASIEDVRQLGNSGGGDLGEVLALFAAGNHALMRGAAGRLDSKVPEGLFSLELPGSQGSHPGHSGILEGDPAMPGSGRLSEADFARLAERAVNGLITRSEVGRFIAENLRRDPKSKVAGAYVAGLLARDVGAVLKAAVPAPLARLFGAEEERSDAPRALAMNITKLTGENNLLGSAGEFGLLFAFLGRKPGAVEVDGEPAVTLEDVRSMFVEKRLPAGWQSWKKLRSDWVGHTTALLLSAAKEYVATRR